MKLHRLAPWLPVMLWGCCTIMGALGSDPGQLLWRHSTGYNVLSPPGVSPDGSTVYFLSGDEGDPVHLYAVGQGQNLWVSQDLGPASGHGTVTLSPDGTTLYVAMNNQPMRAISTADGHTLWASADVLLGDAPIVSPDSRTVYLPSSPNQASGVKAVNSLDGSLAQAYSSLSISALAVSANGGTLFSVGSSGLVAVQASTGKQLWTTPVQGQALSLTTDGRTIFVVEPGQYIAAFKAGTGQQLWSRAVSGSVSVPIVTLDSNVLFISQQSSHDPRWYSFPMALHTQTGQLLWSKADNQRLYTSPALSRDGTTLLIGSNDFNVYALNSQDGSSLWTYTTTSKVKFAPAISSDGAMAYIIGSDYTVHAVTITVTQPDCLHGMYISQPGQLAYCFCSPHYSGSACATPTSKARRVIAPVTGLMALMLLIGFLVRERRRRPSAKKLIKPSSWALHPMFQIGTPAPPLHDGPAPSQPHLKRKDTTSLRAYNISMEGMGLILPSGKTVLTSVDGSFGAGRLSAIMGPSGAGKTSLLDCLSGKIAYTAGQILLNNRVMESGQQPWPLKRVLGMVPQDDIMLTELTVQEVISFSASLRLPRTFTREERKWVVNKVLRRLRLTHVRQTVVGDTDIRGVSGGERRRVSIGMELVVGPRVLLLDEPTSGLDSSSAKELVQCLKAMSATGMTIVLSLHQPSIEIFHLIDDVLFLRAGGLTAYMGPTMEALNAFVTPGTLSYASDINPADYIMELLTRHNKGANNDDGEVSCYNNYPAINNTPAQESVDSLSRKRVLSGSSGKRRASRDRGHTDEDNNHSLDIDLPPGTLGQYRILLHRSWLQWTRQANMHALYSLLILSSALILGLINKKSPYQGPPPPQVCIDQTPQIQRECLSTPVADRAMLNDVMVVLDVGLMAMSASIAVLGNERTVFRRERSAGISSLAYFLAKVTVEVLSSLYRPAFFLFIFYSIHLPYAYYSDYFISLFLVDLVASGLGILVSTILEPNMSQFAGVVLVMTASLVSGVSPPLSTFKYPVRLMANALSFARWGVESLALGELHGYNPHFASQTIKGSPPLDIPKDYWRPAVENGLDNLTYSWYDYPGLCWGMLLFQALAFRLVAYLLLSLSGGNIWQWRTSDGTCQEEEYPPDQGQPGEEEAGEIDMGTMMYETKKNLDDFTHSNPSKAA